MSLITQLKQISDPRHLRGRRHELWVILFLSLLGFLCGYPLVVQKTFLSLMIDGSGG